MKNFLLSQSIFHQFLRFATVGVIATFTQYVVMILLVESTHMFAALASSTGFVIAGLVNYYLNYRLTFKSNKLHRETITKFMIIFFSGFFWNLLLMTLGTEVLNIYYILSQIFTTIIVMFWNFLGHRYWTFRESNYD